MWDSIRFFDICGRVEGLATTAGGTATAAGEALSVPDGPFGFAADGDIQAAIDPFTVVVPGPPPGAAGGPQPMGVCNSTAQHCSAVRNADGATCVEPTPSTPPNCWGQPDFSSSPPHFVPYTDQQCQQICYAMNLYSFGGPMGAPPWIMEALDGAGLCVEGGVMDMSQGPGDPNAIRKTGNPIGRFMLDRLNYSCDDVASVVHRFATFAIGLPRSPNSPPGPPQICHVTQRAEITLKAESQDRVIGDFKMSASLAPDDPADCTDDTNPQNPIAGMLRNPMRMFVEFRRQ